MPRYCATDVPIVSGHKAPPAPSDSRARVKRSSFTFRRSNFSSRRNSPYPVFFSPDAMPLTVSSSTRRVPSRSILFNRRTRRRLIISTCR